MNCKPGEYAFIIRDEFPENIGKLVRVLGTSPLAKPGEWLVDPQSQLRIALMIGELIVKEEVAGPGARDVFCYDWDLLPIRPGDISDEEVRDLYAPKLPEVVS